jgi:hypothetical protein
MWLWQTFSLGKNLSNPLMVSNGDGRFDTGKWMDLSPYGICGES